MKAIVDYFSAMLPYVLASLPFSIILRIILVKRLQTKGLKAGKERDIVWVLFVMFMVALVSQTILPDFSEISLESIKLGLERVNLIPFKEIRIAFSLKGSFFLVNFIGNIVMFLPIAFFVGLLYNKPSFLKCVLITTGFSVLVELCQLPQDRGTDIDDVILNTLGGIVGYLLYLLVDRIFPKFSKKCKVN